MITASSPFEIIRRRKTLNWSGGFTSTTLAGNSGTANGTVTAPRGLALMTSATNPEALVPASGTGFVGFITRRVVVGGLTPFERAIGGVVSVTPEGLEAPYTDGLEVTAELAQTVECEANGTNSSGFSYYVTSGTGAITAGTAAGSKLSFNGLGQFYVAQGTDQVFALLATPPGIIASSDGVATRIRVEMI